MAKRHQYPSHQSAYRQKQYAENAGYRKRVRQNTRDRYRKTHEVYVPDTKGGLARASKVGQVRSVASSGGERRRIKTYTVSEVAGLVGRSSENLFRWFERNLLPRPVYFTTKDKTGVYTVAEVTAILRILSKHFETTAYYRFDHLDTREALFSAVYEVRRDKGDVKSTSS